VLFISIIAAGTAFLFGAPLFGYWLGGVWLANALTDYHELAAFWTEKFAPRGGVAQTLRSESRDTPVMTANEYMQLIAAEFNVISRMRRRMLIVTAFLGLFWYWVSVQTSDWLFMFFLAGLAVAAFFYPRSGSQAVLTKLFRNVRLWMDADPGSLAQYATQLHVNGILLVLRDKEPTETAEPLFGT